MKIVMCQPSIKRFEWELDVAISNLKKHNITDVVLLFAEFDHSVFLNLKNKFPYLDIYTYKDDREDSSYIPSIKPYLWYRFLSENPGFENEDFLYIDSDVIFREMIDFNNFTQDNKWYGSDCTGYLGYDYILKTQNGEKIISEMAKIVGVNLSDIKKIKNNCIGAQLIVKKPKAKYWKKVYEDSNKLYHYFEEIDSDIQKWTAEMWSQLWNMIYFDIEPKSDDEFDFSWATDNIEEWHKKKIYHNAGVTPNTDDLFFKGKYTNASPFNDDLSFVNNDKCSYHYVKAIEYAKNS